MSFTEEALDDWLDIRDRSRCLLAIYDQFLAADTAGADTAALTACYNECIDALAVDIADFVQTQPPHLVGEATKCLPLQVAKDLAKRLKKTAPR